MSSQLILESPPTQDAYGDEQKNQQEKVISPSNFSQPDKALISLPQ
jgi:hypothetical protein